MVVSQLLKSSIAQSPFDNSVGTWASPKADLNWFKYRIVKKTRTVWKSAQRRFKYPILKEVKFTSRSFCLSFSLLSSHQHSNSEGNDIGVSNFFSSRPEPCEAWSSCSQKIQSSKILLLNLMLVPSLTEVGRALRYSFSLIYQNTLLLWHVDSKCSRDVTTILSVERVNAPWVFMPKKCLMTWKETTGKEMVL